MLLESRANERVDNVKTIAQRIAKQGEGLSIREFLDASALAAGSLIRILYRGPGVRVAVERYMDALYRAVNKP
jgi:hypothetical protein